MRDILDPADIWLGTPVGAIVFGNKRPVALDDTAVVVKDGGPVTVIVLANDYDPEGGALTLISASAALGTAIAEADNTVTYTPPPGITGTDTVLYEIADDLDQRRTAQIDITITSPAEFAGSYQISTSDLAGGPVNLVPPTVTGTAATGQALAAGDGLWVYDTSAGTPMQSWQWQRDGADIPGATASGYTVTAADIAEPLTVTETQTDTFGQRSAVSSPATAAFLPSDDTALIGWWDADDAATITATGGAVSAWAGKLAGQPVLSQGSGPQQPVTAARQLNGGNVLDFTGTAFLSAPLALPASGDVAFHAALIIDGVTNPFQALLAADAASNDFQVDAEGSAQFDGRLNLDGLGASFNFTGGPFSGAVILSVILDRTAGVARAYVSNAERGNTAYTASISPSVTLNVMANRTLNALADGAVAEIIVTGDVSNRTAHHGYLASKWSLI